MYFGQSLVIVYCNQKLVWLRLRNTLIYGCGDQSLGVGFLYRRITVDFSPRLYDLSTLRFLTPLTVPGMGFIWWGRSQSENSWLCHNVHATVAWVGMPFPASHYWSSQVHSQNGLVRSFFSSVCSAFQHRESFKVNTSFIFLCSVAQIHCIVSHGLLTSSSGWQSNRTVLGFSEISSANNSKISNIFLAPGFFFLVIL